MCVDSADDDAQAAALKTGKDPGEPFNGVNKARVAFCFLIFRFPLADICLVILLSGSPSRQHQEG